MLDKEFSTRAKNAYKRSSALMLRNINASRRAVRARLQALRDIERFGQGYIPEGLLGPQNEKALADERKRLDMLGSGRRGGGTL